ncbi:MAG: DUF1552 domain-containing protein [Acidobacteria bacterium]|nr:DUF1552 domain-containing protein [Acidobacteriota bacterium]
MIITRKAIPRRAVLRGIGATVALPLLDGMLPALASQRPPVSRLSIVFAPNGMNMATWTPAGDPSTSSGSPRASSRGEDAAFQFSPTLEPLAPFRDRLLVLSGLDNSIGDARPGEGESAPHERAGGVFLTSVHPEREGRAGVSMDQVLARELGRQTELASLELGLHANDIVGQCEKGWSCAYMNTLSWRTPTTPLPVEYRPRAVFERLFGDSDSSDPAVRRARIERDRSLLDSVTDAAARLMRSVGAADRARLTEYLEGMRDIERRIQRAEEQSARELPAVDRPAGIPTTFEEHARLMFDLQVLALQADLTRVITFMLGPEQSNRAYPEIGVPDVHHGLSHHQGDARKLSKIAQIDAYHTRTFAYYLEALQATREGDGSLLDHATVVFGCSMSDGNDHLLQNLPIVVAGGSNGQLKGGRHVRFPKGTPVSNLYLALMDMVGVHLDRFGDSTGRLSL